MNNSVVRGIFYSFINNAVDRGGSLLNINDTSYGDIASASLYIIISDKICESLGMAPSSTTNLLRQVIYVDEMFRFSLSLSISY